jgi:hypothetical protein
VAEKINVIGAKPRKIDVADQPKRRIGPLELASALGANAKGQRAPRNLDLVDLAELGTQFLDRLKSNGGRPALADETETCHVPLSAEDVNTLEMMVARIGESTGAKPSVGQLVSVIVHNYLAELVS